MTHAESDHPNSALANPVRKSLVPMFRMWGRSIGWTVLLSTLLAIVFALMCDGCSISVKTCLASSAPPRLRGELI